MSISLVINTNCLGDSASGISSGGKGVAYAGRAYALRNLILPLYTRWAPVFREIVVVGEYEEGEGYTYVPCDSIYRNCADALIQRQAGFEALTKNSEWVLFMHDDHLWDVENLIPRTTPYDVISPSRWTRLRGAPERLNNGETLGHISGHAVLMRPSVLRAFRWSSVPPVFTWDIETQRMLETMGYSVGREESVKVWDVEMGSEPWR